MKHAILAIQIQNKKKKRNLKKNPGNPYFQELTIPFSFHLELIQKNKTIIIQFQGRNLFEMKGMSKCVETAMRPVPERSHMLKTCPTKAGPPPPPPFPLAPSRATRTVFAAGRAGSEAVAAESRALEAESGGAKKRVRESEEGGCGSVTDGGFGGLKREAKLEAVDWRKAAMWLL